MPHLPISQKVILAVFLSLLLTTNTALADRTHMRCGNSIIELGDHSFMVLKKCGNNLSK